MKLFGNTHSKRQAKPLAETEPDSAVQESLEEPAAERPDDIPHDEPPAEPATEPETLDFLFPDPIPVEAEESWDDADEDEEEDEEETEEERALGKKRLKIVLIVGLSLLAVVLIGCAIFVNYLLGLINYQAANSDYFNTISAAEALPEEEPISELLSEKEAADLADDLEITPEMLAQMDKHLEDVTSDSNTYEIPISEDVYNILLIGTDNRDQGGVGRSDAMILVSINQKNQTIFLSSFLRDCYVHIPGYGNTRLNHAFAYGGPDLLMETLEENFKVHVDKYVAVDFYSFMDVIDVLGGVWIEISDEEREVANEYIWSMNKLLGEEWSTDYLWSSGWHLLNGKQALAYARDRYTGSDYARTQRQRTIINHIIYGAMHSSPATLVDLAQVILPQITTDLGKSQVLNYAANVMAYLDYDIVQQQIPVAGSYHGATISGMSVISLDLDENIAYLQGTIYGDTPVVGDGEEQTEVDDEE